MQSAAFNALAAHAAHRREHGIPDSHVLTEAEKDEISRKRSRSPPPPTQEEMSQVMEEEDSSEGVEFKTPNPRASAARRQLFESSSGVDEEEPEGEDEPASLLHAVPDLREYFLQFPAMDTKSIISMLRAYASYLATQVKKEPPKKRSKGT